MTWSIIPQAVRLPCESEAPTRSAGEAHLQQRRRFSARGNCG
jgi:hypothetical protein